MLHKACTPTATPRGGLSQTTTSFAAMGKRVRAPSLFIGNQEPSLDELIGDELVGRVMARDGLHPDQVRVMMEDMRARLA